MASVNKVLLIGNLTRDPETRYAPSGDAICNVSMATNEQWKDKATGEKKEAVEFHRVVFFGKLAEIAGQFLKKGRQIYIEGSLRTRKWTDKDGQERYTTEIKADEMKMLGTAESGGEQSARPVPRPAPSASVPQEQASGFDDFVMPCPDLDWEISQASNVELSGQQRPARKDDDGTD